MAISLANHSGYSFTMDHYYVSGKKNGATCGLRAGSLTNSGGLRVYKKAAGAVGPSSVTANKDEIIDDTICILSAKQELR